MENYEQLKQIDVGITGYTTIHYWLTRTYGKPSSCIHCQKHGSQNSKDGRWNIQWALIKGKKHERKRENYIPLCVLCHNKYDKKTPTYCTVPNCKRPYRSTGYCLRHYSRFYYREKLATSTKTYKINE